MKTFAISLASSLQRRSYIEHHLSQRGLDFELVEAVDGSKLTQKELEELCDMATVSRLRWWLTNGAIGCALSHRQAYKKVVDQNLPYAFVVEDDIILPKDINELLNSLEQIIKPDDIVLLYYASFKLCKLSTHGKAVVRNRSLLFPIDVDQTITATAYIIGQEAARKMVQLILPVQVTADSWGHYYKSGAFRSLRCVYPMPVKTMHFKSSIDYMTSNSFKGILSGLIDRYKIPPFFQLLRVLRKRRTDSMLTNFELTDNISPMYRQ